MYDRIFFERYYNSFIFKELVRLPNHPSRHHFRFQFKGKGKKSFKRINDRIRSIDNLTRNLIKFIPSDVYCSVVEWLDPINVAKSKDELDVMLSSPLFIDIDPPGDLKIEEKYSWLKSMGFSTLRYMESNFNLSYDNLIFSGNGIHILYNNFDWMEIRELDPKQRILCFTKNRKQIWEEFIIEGIITDYQSICDSFRIRRLPGSINSRSDLPCFEISTNELKRLSKIVKLMHQRIKKEVTKNASNK